MKWIYFLRSFIAVLLYPVFTLLVCGSCILQNILFGSKKLDNLWVKTWGLGTCWMFGVKIRVDYSLCGQAENLFKDGGIVLFNHKSFFDVFALTGAFPFLRFGAKAELFKIPVFGYSMKRMGVIPIFREEKEKTIQVYRETVERIKKGEIIALAPEGKRVPDMTLGNFKSGPFLFALQAQVPLIPLCVFGAQDVLPKFATIPNPWAKSKLIEIFVLNPHTLQGEGPDAKSKFQRIVYDQMKQVLEAKPPSASASH